MHSLTSHSVLGAHAVALQPGHLHVDTAGDKSGVMAGFVQMLQGNLGPGILTLPYVFTQGGVIITSAMLILVRMAVAPWVIVRVRVCKTLVRIVVAP